MFVSLVYKYRVVLTSAESYWRVKIFKHGIRELHGIDFGFVAQ